MCASRCEGVMTCELRASQALVKALSGFGPSGVDNRVEPQKQHRKPVSKQARQS